MLRHYCGNMWQKKYDDSRRQHAEFEFGTKVLLSTCNLRLHGTRKFRDRFVGLFAMTQQIGETAYRLDLSSCVALHGVHNLFHVSLLRDWWDNGVHADVLPIEINREAEYKVSSIKGYRECNGEL